MKRNQFTFYGYDLCAIEYKHLNNLCEYAKHTRPVTPTAEFSVSFAHHRLAAVNPNQLMKYS